MRGRGHHLLWAVKVCVVYSWKKLVHMVLWDKTDNTLRTDLWAGVTTATISSSTRTEITLLDMTYITEWWHDHQLFKTVVPM